MGRQVAHELGEVAPRVGQALYGEQRRARVVLDEGLGGVEHQLGVRDAEDVLDVLELDLVAAVGDELLERPEGVPEGSRGGSGQHPDGGVGQLDLLLRGHPAQDAGDLLETRDGGSRSGGSGPRSWPEPCAPRSWRARRPRAVGAPRASSGRRSRRPRRACAPRRGCRRAGRPASAPARRSRAARGCRRPSCWTRRPSPPRRARCPRVSPGSAPRRDRRRHSRPTVGVQRAGQQLGHGGLARAPRADEQIGVMDLVQLDRVAQRSDHMLLAHHLVEGPRAVAAIEREHRSPHASTSRGTPADTRSGPVSAA